MSRRSDRKGIDERIVCCPAFRATDDAPEMMSGDVIIFDFLMLEGVS